MKNYKSWSAIRPEEWDKTSCPDVVYHNTNIVQKTMQEEPTTIYEYDVTEYTNKEYIAYQDEQIEGQKAITDYNIMMGNLEDPADETEE